MPKIPFTGQTYESRSPAVNMQQCINWYVETDPTGVNNVVLYPTPGKVVFATCGSGPIRGMHVKGVLLYVISGNTLYEVNTSGGVTVRGTLSTSSGTVLMADNGSVANEILICDGTRGEIYDEDTTTLTPIADADFPDTATHPIFADGFFVVNDPSNAGRFYKSESYDGTDWGVNNFATAERDPDNIQAVIKNHNYIYLIGEETTELWQNVGTFADFPFEPLPGALMEIGCAAPYSVAKNQKDTIWLAKDKDGQGQVIKVTGTQFQVISTYPIEESINNYSTISDAVGWVYKQAGHTFYQLTFPTGNETWVYDFKENKWHQRQSYDSGSNNRDRGLFSVFFGGKILTGDRANGQIYQQSLSTFTEDGNQVRHVRRSQTIQGGDGEDYFYEGLFLKFNSAMSNSTVPNPQIRVRYSDDDGNTWSNWMKRTLVANTISGVTDSTTANKLVNSGAQFSTDGVQVGMTVYNTTDGTSASVSTVDSETQLTLDADIFVSGEEYTIGDFSASSDGKLFSFRDLKPARARVFEVECSDAVNYVLVAAYATINPDNSNI